MNIWEILAIEPTTDKRAIRRAYAAKTRVIHPEEKPEEFKQLHAAYQAALKYAEFALERQRDFEKIVKEEVRENGKDSINDNGGSSAADKPVNQEQDERSELLSFFTENQEKQQQRIDAFMQRWRELKNIIDDTKVYEWWQEYLASDDFQNIRWNAQVLHLLIEEIDDKFFYGTNEMKMLFWNAYGFRENDESRYQGEQQELWKCLYPAYEYYVKLFWAREFERKGRRNFYIFVAVAVICAVAAGIIVSVKNRVVTEEDYGSQLLEYYAAQYGLECGQLEYERREYGEDGYYSQEKELCNVLYYPDIEKLDTFCETVVRMFDEQEELKAIPSVGICAGDILFPQILLQGGVIDFPAVTPQIYDLRNADRKELAAQLEEAYIIYMFQYESWNVSLEQCGEWGPVYQEACWQWQNHPGVWYDITDLNTGEVLCTLYASTYIHADYGRSVPAYEEWVTVGNAYDLLRLQGVDVTVDEDGSGFIAQIDGEIVTFGSEPGMRLDQLGPLSEEVQDVMQNHFFILE